MLQKLKIGLVLSDLPGYSETFIKNKILVLTKSGYKVSLYVTKKRSIKLFDNKIKIKYQVNTKNKFYNLFLLLYFFIRKPIVFMRFIKFELMDHKNFFKSVRNLIINLHIIKDSLDWIHFSFSTNAIDRENVASAIGAKLAISFRGYDIGIYPYQNPNCYNILWKKIDRVHTISDDLYNRAIKLGLDSNIECYKINPAINLEKFISSKNNEIQSPIRILTVGRLNWKKGYEYTLEALGLLKKYNIQFEYRIIGEGNYQAAIEFAIKQLNLEENIIVKKSMPQSDIIKEMEWANIYIQSSIQEGFCNAVLEAQSMGLLCIVSDADGLTENIIDKKSGWVVEKRNSRMITNSIIELINMSKSEREKIINFAKERIQKQFNLNNHKDLFSNFYNEKNSNQFKDKKF